MLAALSSAALNGIDGHHVLVEVHVSAGLPAYDLVGLPDTAGRESRQRIRAAILSSELQWPMQRITVNLAPAVVRKAGTGLEVAVACAVLVASEQLDPNVFADTGLIGELGLDGRLRPVAGTLVLVDTLRRQRVRRVIVPVESAAEASLVPDIEVRAARSLRDIVDACTNGAPWAEARAAAPRSADPLLDAVDLDEVRGLPNARRALNAAAAGGHHLLLVGPPGSGKTMLARRYPTIAAPLDPDYALEVTRIASASGTPIGGELIDLPPFRAPHHSASAAALIGGGSTNRVRIGEITRAHRGALFLDEFGEFSPSVLDALRQPLEDRSIHISRAGISTSLPADFTLIACCNPCPCGLGEDACRCNDVARARYRRRLSEPLLDRFDLRVVVSQPKAHEARGPSSAETRAIVARAIERQHVRFADATIRRNAHIPQRWLDQYAPLNGPAQRLLHDIAEFRALSGRGLARVWRVARTLADLDDVDMIDTDHIDTAANLRDEVV